MNDLISRKAVEKAIKDYFKMIIDETDDDVDCVLDYSKNLGDTIMEIPTAYDVDKVIEKLEQISSLKENAKLKSENSKLKAEIEQLELSCDSVETSSIKYYNLYKKSLEQIARLKEQVEVKDNNFELYCDLVDENERLYAELGKLGWNR